MNFLIRLLSLCLLSLIAHLPLVAMTPNSNVIEKGYKKTPSYYVGATGGIVVSGDFSSHSYEAALRMDQLGSEFMAGACVGTYYNKNWRFELEFRQRVGMRYQHFQESSTNFSCNVGRLDSKTLTLGTMYRLGSLENAHPYIGAGVGVGINTLRKSESLNNLQLGITFTYPKSTRKNFVYFGRVGTLINLYKSFKLDLNYSFIHLGTAHTGTSAFRNASKLENIRLQEVAIALIYGI